MSNLENHIKNLKWPKLDDKLFDGSDSSNWMNACLDFIGQEEKFYIYASGYREAAEIIYNNLDSKSRYHDILVYPIVFLTRQSIELLLKDIIITSYKILSITQGFPKHHTLIKLWQEVKSLLLRMQIDFDKKDVKAMVYLLGEFDKIDPISSSFRYTVDQDENESLPSITKIDLKNFMNVSLGIYNFLKGTTIQVSEYYDNLKGSI
jgi:hypothetical protein